jgi:hypothetical protein
VESRDELVKTAFAIKLVTDKDLIFFDRKTKIEGLPEWAEVGKKLTMNSEL